MQLKGSNVFITISGMIGAGKSTMARELGKHLELPVYYEPVDDHEYLEDFYKDMTSVSFAMQVYLLNKRFEQHQQIIWSKRGGVQDRTIYEDSIFAKILRDTGMMTERDYRTYCSLFANMSNFMRHPNFIVHLDVTPEESLERIKRRGRDCEAGIGLDYLQRLHAGYEEFLADISRTIPVIRVKWDRFRSAEDVAQHIMDAFTRMSTVVEVRWDGATGTKDTPGTPTPNIHFLS